MKFIAQQGRHAQQYVACPCRWKGVPHSKLTTRISACDDPRHGNRFALAHPDHREAQLLAPAGRLLGVRADPDIPWLLLSAKSNEGQGAFKNVTFIQRLGTHGGKPPTADADAAHAGKEVRVEYQATYYFYVPGP